MVSFDDKEGNKKVVELTIGCVKRIKAKTGIDLVSPIEKVDGKTAFERIVENPMLLCDILYEMLDEDGKTEESFANCLDGYTIQRAYKAFMDELLNFSQPLTKAILQKLMEMSEEVGQKQMEELNSLPKAFGEQYMNLQVSSESTPTN